MACDLVVGTNDFDIVPGAAKRLDHGRVESALQFQAGRLGTPGPAEQPARRRNRPLQVLTIEDMTGENRGLGLGPALTAHGSVGQDPAIRESGQGRLDGVEGPPPGLQAVVVALVQA